MQPAVRSQFASESFTENLKEKLPLAFIFLSFLGIGLGPSPRAIGMVGAIACILLRPSIFLEMKALFLKPWVYACFIIVILAAVGTLWGPATTAENALIFSRYAKIGYLPLLYLAFNHPKAKPYALNGFIGAMLITAICSILKSYDIIENTRSDAGFVFFNHVLTSYFMSVAIYLCLYQIKKTAKSYLYVYQVILSLLLFQLLFINTGRTGYVSYLILASIWAFQFHTFKKGLLCLIPIFLSLGMSFKLSPIFQHNMSTVKHEVTSIVKKDKNNSLGLRLQFHEYSKKLWLEKPIYGHGTGGFMALFRIENPIPSYKEGILFEPHNIYWLFAVEFGLIGELALFIFFLTLGFDILRGQRRTKLGFALYFSFLIMNLTDSLLFHSASGFYYLFFIALILGMSQRKEAYEQSQFKY